MRARTATSTPRAARSGQGEQAIEQIYGWQPSGDAWYLQLKQPPMSFVALADVFGIQGVLVSSVGELDAALAEGMRAVDDGHPYVVEILTDPSLQAPEARATERTVAP